MHTSTAGRRRASRRVIARTAVSAAVGVLAVTTVGVAASGAAVPRQAPGRVQHTVRAHVTVDIKCGSDFNERISEIGDRKALAEIVCGISQARSQVYKVGALHRDAKLDKVAAMILTNDDIAVPHVEALLKKVGFIKPGYEWVFQRCSVIKLTAKSTPESVVSEIGRTESHDFTAAEKSIGVAIAHNQFYTLGATSKAPGA